MIPEINKDQPFESWTSQEVDELIQDLEKVDDHLTSLQNFVNIIYQP